MSDPIGPGDWVECVENRLATTAPPLGLVVGRIYRVEAIGVTPPDDRCPDVAYLRLVGCPPRPGKLGFRAAWFRPVRRPGKSTLIRDLLTKAPEGEEA